MWYTLSMKDIPLIKSNSYLKHTAQREKMFVTAVHTSTAIEGVHVVVSSNGKELHNGKAAKHSKKLS